MSAPTTGAADFAHSPWAQEARTAKAVRLEAWLRTEPHGYTQGDLYGPGEDVAKRRRAVEKAAGTRRASEETWQLVARLLDPGPS